MSRLVKCLTLMVLLFLPAAVEASGQRLALVVGIDGYVNITPLQTAVNDVPLATNVSTARLVLMYLQHLQQKTSGEEKAEP